MTPALLHLHSIQNSRVNPSQTESLGAAFDLKSSLPPQPKTACTMVAGDLARPLLDDCLDTTMQPIPSMGIQSFLNFQSRIQLTQVFSQGYEAVNAIAHNELNLIRQTLAKFLINKTDPQDHAAMLSDFVNVRGILSPDYILTLLNSSDLATVRCGACLVDTKHFQKTDLIVQAVNRVMGHQDPDFQLVGLELAYRAPIDHPIRHFSNINLNTQLPVEQQLAILEGFEQECMHRPQSIPELCHFLAADGLEDEVRDAVVQAVNGYFEFALQIGGGLGHNTEDYKVMSRAYQQNLDTVIAVIRNVDTSPRVGFDLFNALCSAVPDHPEVLSLIRDKLLAERLGADNLGEFSVQSLIIKNLRVMSDEGVGYLLAEVHTLLLDASHALTQPILHNLDLSNLGLRIAAYKIVAVAAHLGHPEALTFVEHCVTEETFRDFEQLQRDFPELHTSVTQVIAVAFDCLYGASAYHSRVYFKVSQLLQDHNLAPFTRGLALSFLCTGAQNSTTAKLLLAAAEDDLKTNDCAIFQAFDSLTLLMPSTKKRAFALCVSQLKNCTQTDEERVSALRFLGQDPHQVIAHHVLLEKLLLNPNESLFFRGEVSTYVNAFLLMQRGKTSTLSKLFALLSRLESEGSNAGLQCAKYMKLSWFGSMRVWDNEVLAALGDPNLNPNPSDNLRWAFSAIDKCSRMPCNIWDRLQHIALNASQPEWLRVNAMRVTLKFRPEGVSPEPFWTAAINSGSLPLGHIAMEDMDRRLYAILR